MIPIKGLVPPTRRPDALGVHSLDHFSIKVPDLAKAKDFYSTFGLDVHAKGNHLDLLTYGSTHRWGYVVEAGHKRMNYLSFGIFEDDIERFRSHFHRLGIEEVGPPLGLESNAIWIHDMDGILLELKVAEKTSPSAKSEFGQAASALPGIRGAALRGQEKPVLPRRLAHALVFVRDVARSVRFYNEALRMRL